ncbi:MAG: TolB-like 6-bladed beta-propeller domain-containing protein [Tannerella sp.]|nr:TolB-like 6-bladed beta-propeller domain-containing protein [Tannerella sp.]
MKKNLLFPVLALVILSACSPDAGTPAVYLTGINPETEDVPYMRFPFRIGLSDSVAVMLDLAADSCFYHVVSYPDFQYLYSLGKRGNGPGEIILPTPFQLHGGHLFLFDGNRSNIFDMNLSGKQNTGLEDYIHFNDLSTCVDFVRIDDTTFLMGDLSGRNRLLRVTPQTRTGILDLPGESAGENGADHGYIWRSYMDMNYELNKVALVTQYGAVLEIVDLNDWSVIRTVGKAGFPRSAKQHVAEYYDVKWRKNDIYALYSDVSETESNRQRAGDQKSLSGGDRVHVFDQNGVMTKTYHLDVPINGFTIDEKNNLLIGISSNSDWPVYIFKLD